MQQFAQAVQGVMALDGKTLRRSYDRAGGRSPLRLVSAWAEELRLVLGQLTVADKSSGITAVPQLPELLTLGARWFPLALCTASGKRRSR